ncbi:o-acyltransferase [Anaeramoeba ignava]|uniref:O-acyltransferase n=1 Tax=Anaeramoeba ignava TaxID=1746090 RepID=A0A9Q0L5R0_ANAIG|nr:o-acyltransferase [Anaeramoeba ignava]
MKLNQILFFFIFLLFLIPNSKQDPQTCYNEILDVFYYRNASHSSEMIEASSFKYDDLGNFDECYALTKEEIAKYSLISVDMAGVSVKIGVCFPFVCSQDDLYAISPELKLFFNLPSDVILDFQVYKKFALDWRASIMITTIIILVLIGIIGTIIDYQYFVDKEEKVNEKNNSVQNPKWMMILKQFSFILNFKQLTQEHPQSIKFLNGLRVISMLWIMLGHTYSYTLDIAGIINVSSIVDIFRRFTFQIIPGAQFGVDTFFFLSGFLVSYLMLKKMKQNNGKFVNLWKFYLHRYIRLAPTFTFILFFSYTLAPYLGYGPNWEFTRDFLQTRCQKYWWTNLLLINNFHPRWENQCMGNLWYIANDWQFYVVSPFIILIFFRKKIFGWITSLSIFIISYILSVVISSHYSLSPSILGPGIDDYYTYYYSKPYCRIPTFLIGICLAVFITQFDIKKFKIPRYLKFSLALVASFFLAISVFGTYSLYKDDKLDVQESKIDWDHWSKPEKVIWISFSKSVFILGVAIFSFLFLSGNLVLVNDFLSSKIWIPFSKLTYSVYVLQPILIVVVIGSFRDSIYFSGLSISKFYVFNVVAGYFFAMIITLIVEFPFSNLQRLLLSR